MKLKEILLLTLLSNLSLYASNNLPHLDSTTQSIAIGTNSSASGTHSTAIGYNSQAKDPSSIAMGANASADGSNSISIGSHTVTSEDSSIAIGSGSHSVNSGSVAIGDIATSQGENSVAIGYQSNAKGSGSVAIGITAEADGAGSVAIGDDSKATESNTVSIGNSGLKRKLVNMKDGVADSDGATVGQLNEKADKTTVAQNTNNINANKNNINKNSTNINKIYSYTINNNRNIANKAEQEDVDRNTREISQNTNEIHSLNSKVDHLNSKLNEGMSLMAAMSAIDFGDSQKGDLLLGAGVGHYVNSDAVALGLSYSPSENLRVNGKYSVSTDDPSSSAAGIGMTYRLANFN
ncbi:MAG: YadA-like family protein [Cetobacterium sp.]|uniref:YadA-like family protein n=1 Tax=Cetobacterium sp. TaxID=2071632 RepID=UPI003F3FD659